MTKQLQMKRIENRMNGFEETTINERVEELKKEFRKIQDDYYKKAFNILSEIIRLRKKQIKGYGLGNLSREKGIELTIHQIMYIFGYKYLSSYAQEQIDKQKLKPSTALFIIKQDTRFRQANYQNKAIKLYLDGKMNTTELSRLGKNIIFDNVITESEVALANKQLLNISSSLQEQMKVLKSKRNLFSDKKTLQYIKSQSKKFRTITMNSLITDIECLRQLKSKLKDYEKLIDDILKFGENIK